MSILKIIQQYYILSRPLNVLISMLSVWVATIIAGDIFISETIILACLCAGFITSGANIINDIFDVEIDKINKPQRLIASGIVSNQMAWIFFIFSYLSGLFFSLLAGTELLIIAFVFAGLLYWYSFRLKRIMLWGNFIVSLATGFAFIFGAVAAGDWQAGIIPAIFAFLFHFGREIIKDMEDISGDKASHAKTFPIIKGYRASAILVITLFTILIMLTIIPYILHIYNLFYLIIVILGVDSVLIVISAKIWKKQSRHTLGRISLVLKLNMFIGLIAIYLG